MIWHKIKVFMTIIMIFTAAIVALVLSWIIVPLLVTIVLGIVAAMVIQEMGEKREN